MPDPPSHGLRQLSRAGRQNFGIRRPDTTTPGLLPSDFCTPSDPEGTHWFPETRRITGRRNPGCYGRVCWHLPAL